MKLPNYLYRYRSLNQDIFNRELNALQNDYIFASTFQTMNDPMEAFYTIEIAKTVSPSISHKIKKEVKNIIDNACLISFTEIPTHYPMWTYYASNFSGMCLEFNVEKLCEFSFKKELPSQLFILMRHLNLLQKQIFFKIISML